MSPDMSLSEQSSLSAFPSTKANLGEAVHERQAFTPTEFT